MRVMGKLITLIFCEMLSLSICAQSNSNAIAQSPNSQIDKKSSKSATVKPSGDLLEKRDAEKPRKSLLLNDAIYLARFVNSEAFKLEPKNQIWVKLQIARLLGDFSKDEGIHILEDSFTLLHGLKKSLTNQSEYQKEKQELKSLERELIIAYCKLNPEKGQPELKKLLESASKAESLENATTKNIDARQQADELANIARNLLQAGNSIGVDVLLKSILLTGKISTEFLGCVIAAGSRPELLRRLETALPSVLKGRATLDWEDIHHSTGLLIGSRFTQQNTRNAILEFELNSLRQIETLVRTAREQGQASSIDGDSIGYIYSTFNSPLLRMFIKEMPGSEKEITTLLKSLAGSLPGDWAANARRDFGGMTFEQRLEEASRYPLGEQRENLLIALAMDALRDKFKGEPLPRHEMVNRVMDKIASSESKSILSDYLSIAEAMEDTNQGNYILAADKARQVARGDWRGLVLAGIASVVEEKDHDEAVRLYMQSLLGLDNCDPSITRVEVAFKVAEMMRKTDPILSQSLISRAIQYANTIDFSEQKKLKKFPDYYAKIGKTFFILGMEAFQEKDVLRYCNIAELARQDWKNLYLSSQSIENHLLQSIFQIKMCEGILAASR